MSYSLERIRDNRSLKFAKRQYSVAKKNEPIALSGLTTYLIAHGRDPQYTYYEQIDESERFADGKKHANPDSYLFVDAEVYTLEVKVFLGHKDCSYVPFKTAQILSMRDNPNTFPNPYGFYANRNGWSMVSLQTILKSPYSVIDIFSSDEIQKKGFLVPKTAFKMKPWVSPPDFISY